MATPGDRQPSAMALLDAIDPHQITEDITRRLFVELPELSARPDPVLRTTTYNGCLSNVTAVWDAITQGTPVDGIQTPDDAVAWAHELVHRGISLATLLRAYRIGQAMVMQAWEATAEDLGLDAETRWDVLTSASRYAFAHVDIVCTALTEQYADEYARWGRGAAASRLNLVNSLLDGESIDIKAAQNTLGYPLSSTHLALVLWFDPNAEAGVRGSRLDNAARSVAAHLGGQRTMLIEIGERVVWAWTTGARITDNPGSPVTQPSDIRVAVGSPALGVEGFAQSHRDALLARATSELLAAPSQVLFHRSIALLSLLTQDVDRAVRFARSELVGLAGADEASQRLRKTLLVYLKENLSHKRTARAIGVHENTVAYRVHRAEDLIGHRLTDRRLEIEIALALTQHLAL